MDFFLGHFNLSALSNAVPILNFDSFYNFSCSMGHIIWTWARSVYKFYVVISSRLRFVMIEFARCVNSSESSNCGNEIVFNGPTLGLEITKPIKFY